MSDTDQAAARPQGEDSAPLARLGDVSEVVPEHVPYELLQPHVANAVLEQAVALVEFGLKYPSFGIVQGVLNQPDDLPLACVRRMPADA